jgi:hypothetical protein
MSPASKALVRVIIPKWHFFSGWFVSAESGTLSSKEMITNYGQTSGHSFGNSLKVSKKDRCLPLQKIDKRSKRLKHDQLTGCGSDFFRNFGPTRVFLKTVFF